MFQRVAGPPSRRRPAAYYVSYFMSSVLEEAVRVGFGSEQLGKEGRSAVRAALFAPEQPSSALLAAARGRAGNGRDRLTFEGS